MSVSCPGGVDFFRPSGACGPFPLANPRLAPVRGLGRKNPPLYTIHENVLALQTGALRHGAARINRSLTLLDKAHNSVLIHDVRGAGRDAPLGVQDSVLCAHRPVEIAQQRKRQTKVLCKAPVAGSRVHTDSQDLRVGLVEFSDISLIRFEFLRSACGECQHIKGQHHVLLALEITQLDLLAGVVRKRKVRRRVADLHVAHQRCWRILLRTLLCARRHGKNERPYEHN